MLFEEAYPALQLDDDAEQAKRLLDDCYRFAGNFYPDDVPASVAKPFLDAMRLFGEAAAKVEEARKLIAPVVAAQQADYDADDREPIHPADAHLYRPPSA